MTHEKRYNNLIILWLALTMLLIFLMIIVGGLTRLTNSGLSITQWELFKGILPPLSQSSWDNYFELYKDIPQYKILNPLMTLSEFKIIFYWEYAHRMLGRFIGLFFLLPLLYLHFFTKINRGEIAKYYLILFLIILQGVIGWYMVQSGLVNDVTVSHYRLSLHLSGAILILSILFWKLKNLKEGKNKKFFALTKENLPYILLIILIFIQVIFGALVSGLDAGKIYQTWPLMGDNFFPDDTSINNFYNIVDLQNHSLVQFYHRNIAYLISLYIIFLALKIFILKKQILYRPISALIFIVAFQIILGIFTLLSNLNMTIAAAHQISSVILILSSLNLYYLTIK